MSPATTLRWPTESAKSGLHAALAQAPVGFADCDRTGMLRPLNRALGQLLGPLKLPWNLIDIAGAERSSDVRCWLNELRSGGTRALTLEHPIFQASGTTLWLRWTGWALLGPNGESSRALLMAEDVTARRSAELRVRQAERLEIAGRMAGGIAHDFNNVVTGILLYCDLLLHGPQMNPRSLQYVEEIRAAGMQAAGVVRQLLAAVRPQDCPPVALLMNDAVINIKQLLIGLLGEKRTLHLNLDPNLGLVRMRPSQLQQILLNLVLNARDATAEGGNVSIETANCKIHILTETKPDDSALPVAAPTVVSCAVLAVTDDGTGMDVETKEHVFDAFFTTKTAEKGTGLGLTMVHEIVIGNGGLIYLDSTPGCGTRVTILLPLIPDSCTANNEQSTDLECLEGELPVPAKEIML